MKTIVLLSGGMDSAALLYWALRLGTPQEVKAIAFDYGQRHRKELGFAQRLADGVGVEFRCINLSSLSPLLKGSSQSDPEVAVPEGRFDDPSMKLTVVPNRNMIMLSIATAWAISSKFEYVAYAAHTGDHAIYPDCRLDFINTLDKAVERCDWHKVNLITPFIHLDKGDIALEGSKLGVPFNLSWSCYKGLTYHCGKCGACVERKEAFQKSGTGDPTQYEE